MRFRRLDEIYVSTRNVRITILDLELVIAVRTDGVIFTEYAWPTFECASGTFEPVANRVTDMRAVCNYYQLLNYYL